MKRNILVRVLALVIVLMLMPFAMAEEKSIGSSEVGVNYIERMGLGFSLEKNTALRNGDILQSCAASSLSVSVKEAQLTVNENSLLKVENADPEAFSIRLDEGEMFAVVPDGTSITITIGNDTVRVTDTVLMLSAFTGSQTVNVLRGTVELRGETIDAGTSLNILDSGITKSAFSAGSMNEFALTMAITVQQRVELCITVEETEAVVTAREAEKQAEIEEKQAHDAAVLEQGGTVGANTCTIRIVCDTIIDNMQDLTSGKNSYVPANGVILTTSTLSFKEGETVFDVLKRACEYAGIQLEYRWTPVYDSYYIEGINHLYEFDCGNESGWMYKVNGWFPNYGCSKYQLKDGDSIVWCYTCKGLGADVGGGM